MFYIFHPFFWSIFHLRNSALLNEAKGRNKMIVKQWCFDAKSTLDIGIQTIHGWGGIECFPQNTP